MKSSMMTKNMDILPPENAGDDLKRTCSDLKALRESRGFTPKDLFQITKINPDNIEAIENGAFRLLPPPVYAKAFIKTYAKVIGADSKKILEYYGKYLETLKTPCEGESAEISPGTTTSNKKLFLIFSFLSLIILSGIVIFCIYMYRESGGDMPQRHSGEVVSVIPEVKPVGEINPPQTGFRNKKNTEAKPEKSYRLSITAVELTWLRIREGQKGYQEVLLKPGEKIELTAASFDIDVGNAGGINVEFQGKTLANLGKSGQVVHLRLP